MRDATYPSLYQINRWVWLTELSRQLGRLATLDDIPDSELDHLRQRFQKCGLRLMLDSVRKYPGLDHSIASCVC